MTDLPLAGRIALVTGGAVRLGRALALGLAARGANLALHYNSSETAAERTSEEIRALGRKCLLIGADLRQADSPGKIFAAVAAYYGRADILIHSAAVFERGTLEKTSPELWEKTLAINLRAPFFLSQAFASQTEKGDILFLADSRVRQPATEFLAYTLTKSALVTLTRSLAKSLAPRIRVNAVAPGAILPPPGEDEAYLQRLIPRIPLGRPGSPDDIVRGVVYLLEAPFVTGEVLHIDGGEYL
ncbi:MAG: SDR family oxidoreductase [Anaerolineales bacterium]|nr:SDR family oxidoreductase [Anaerolineales bacterium]